MSQSLPYESAERRKQSLRRLLSRPFGWPTHILTTVVFLSVIGGSANYMLPFLVAFFSVPMMLLWWLGRLAFQMTRDLNDTDNGKHRLGHALVSPALALLAVLLVWFEVPERAIFAPNRAELERLALLADSVPEKVRWTRPVGLYGNVVILKNDPGLVGVAITGMGVRGDDGYVYLVNDVPPSPQPRDGWIEEQIAPHWYRWIRSSY